MITFIQKIRVFHTMLNHLINPFNLSLSLSLSQLLGNKDESAVDKNNGAVWGSVGHYGSV